MTRSTMETTCLPRHPRGFFKQRHLFPAQVHPAGRAKMLYGLSSTVERQGSSRLGELTCFHTLYMHTINICYRTAAEMQVNGFPGCRHQGYPSQEAAVAAWEHALVANTIGPVVAPPNVPSHRASDEHIRNTQSHSLSDEDTCWVVSTGQRPGVYLGKQVVFFDCHLLPLTTFTRTLARSAMGSTKRGVVHKFRNITQADRHFVYLYMQNKVVVA
jgi:hypothetical protein